ncbi:MAG: hypothetical protein LBM39_03265 [Candidatus Methanoplasma sp.]|nr:hypothetical protein [Candidatus Methanoplasma sp.]
MKKGTTMVLSVLLAVVIVAVLTTTAYEFGHGGGSGGGHGGGDRATVPESDVTEETTEGIFSFEISDEADGSGEEYGALSDNGVLLLLDIQISGYENPTSYLK